MMPGLSRNATLPDDCTNRAADGGHAERGGGGIRQQAAKQQPTTTYVVQREVELDALEVWMLSRGPGEVLQVLVIGGKQHQRAEAGRADRVALGDCLGGVADRIERVSRLTHIFRQAGHFGNAAGIVGDWTERIERNHHAREREHRGDGDGDTEQTGLRETRIPAMITSAGSAVASSDTARPWMMLVPWPVTDADAIDLTGRKLVPV